MKLDWTRHRLRSLGMVIATAFISAPAIGEDHLRIATYNTSLYGKVAGQIRQRLSDGMDSQAEKVAAIVQTVRPDILLVNDKDQLLMQKRTKRKEQLKIHRARSR